MRARWFPAQPHGGIDHFGHYESFLSGAGEEF